MKLFYASLLALAFADQPQECESDPSGGSGDRVVYANDGSGDELLRCADGCSPMRIDGTWKCYEPRNNEKNAKCWKQRGQFKLYSLNADDHPDKCGPNCTGNNSSAKCELKPCGSRHVVCKGLQGDDNQTCGCVGSRKPWGAKANVKACIPLEDMTCASVEELGFACFNPGNRKRKAHKNGGNMCTGWNRKGWTWPKWVRNRVKDINDHSDVYTFTPNFWIDPGMCCVTGSSTTGQEVKWWNNGWQTTGANACPYGKTGDNCDDATGSTPSHILGNKEFYLTDG